MVFFTRLRLDEANAEALRGVYLENRKITPHQLYAIMTSISLGGSVLVASSTVTSVAKQDSWLSGIGALCYGLVVILLFYNLGKCYPEMTLIGLSRKIFGKWLGVVVSVGYVFVFILTASDICWIAGNYFVRTMHETPLYAVNFLFVAAFVVAVLYGIEAIARLSELLVVFVTVVFCVTFLLLLTDIKPEYMTPVLENGIGPVLRGSYFLSCIITFSTVSILMIYPRYVSDIKGAKTALLKGFILSATVATVAITLSVLVLGSTLTSKLSYAGMVLAAQININDFITRIEYVMSIALLGTHFMVGLFFFFSGITGLSELIGLKNHLHIVIPMGLLVLVLSGVVAPNSIYEGYWVSVVYSPLITTFGLIIPAMLLLVYTIKKNLLNKQ